MALKRMTCWLVWAGMSAGWSAWAAMPQTEPVYVLDMVARDQRDPSKRCRVAVPKALWIGLFTYDRHGRGGPEMRWDCILSTPEGIKAAPFIGKYDEATQTWELDFSDYTPEQYARESPVTKIFPIQGKNSTGAGITNDDLIGDPEQRSRHFQFCLRKPPVALCAWGETMHLADPKRDRLPYALKVIRSLEFLEPDPVPATESPASAP